MEMTRLGAPDASESRPGITLPSLCDREGTSQGWGHDQPLAPSLEMPSVFQALGSSLTSFLPRDHGSSSTRSLLLTRTRSLLFQRATEGIHYPPHSPDQAQRPPLLHLCVPLREPIRTGRPYFPRAAPSLVPSCYFTWGGSSQGPRPRLRSTAGTYGLANSMGTWGQRCLL